jgi:hypothetical protein
MSIFPASVVTEFSILDSGYDSPNSVTIKLDDNSKIDITADSSDWAWGHIRFDEEKLGQLKNCIITSIDQIDNNESDTHDDEDLRFYIKITFVNDNNKANHITFPVYYEDTSGWGGYEIFLNVHVVPYQSTECVQE